MSQDIPGSPTRRLQRLVPGWVARVFLFALLTRLAFLLWVDEPLLYSHQLHYFWNGLWIASQDHPLHFILTSDRWRTWAEHWTIAPGYYVFEAAVFRLLGPHLRPLELIQCVFGAATAVAVAAIGREVSGPRGEWAGLLYGLYAESVELPSWTLTENLHNVLFTAGFAATLWALRGGPGRSLGAGALLGLSALARSVSSAFLAVVALWLFAVSEPRLRFRRVVALTVGASALILPWTARNFAMGEHVLIETAAFENLWWANNFVLGEHLRQQSEWIASRRTPEEKREAAYRFAVRGIERHPDLFVQKVADNFWHYLRADGLHFYFQTQGSIEPWRHVFVILFEDGIVLPLIPLFLVFTLAGRRSAPYALVVSWCYYMLFFEVVVFLNEIPRHRSALIPIALVGGVEGAWLLLQARERRRVGTWVALGLSGLVLYGLLASDLGEAVRQVRAGRLLRGVPAALANEDIEKARSFAEAAHDADPGSARVWNDYGRALVYSGRGGEAIEAYERALPLSKNDDIRATVALPRLLLDAGRRDDAAAALLRAHAFSWHADPWVALECAWRELPPPRTDTILLGDSDYGAVRGFLHPRGVDPSLTRGQKWLGEELAQGPPGGSHRWTRHRAWLRLVPTQEAPAYDLTLVMGSPLPSTLEAPEVQVSVGGTRVASWRLSREIRSYTVRVPSSGGVLQVQIDAPTWNRRDQPAEQGIRVDRMTVSPAS